MGKNLIEEFKMESGGFGNGHDQFMICGKNLDVEPLFKILIAHDFFDLTCEGKISDTCISFHAHDLRFEDNDLLVEISKAYPNAACYWNDCWDNEVDFDCMKNGEDCSEYTVNITTDEDWPDADEDDEDKYRSIEATIVDNATGSEMYIGGGMVCADYVEEFRNKAYASKNNDMPETKTRQNLGTFTIEVDLQSNGKFDVYVAHEGSSGEHYTDVTADRIGEIVADEVETVAEAY